MNLQKYIDWHRELGYEGVYEISPKLANPSAIGFTEMGKVDLPEVRGMYEKGILGRWREVDEQYLGINDDKLVEWAKQQFPFLKFVRAKIQIQRPGERVRPHLDFCGDYLAKVCEQFPPLLKVKHTLEQPGIDIWRLSIGMQDHVEGQIFGFQDRNWVWKKGEYIRINTWEALHWTENKSEVDRAILKVTGIKFDRKSHDTKRVHPVG